jgi:hypothetical protein
MNWSPVFSMINIGVDFVTKRSVQGWSRQFRQKFGPPELWKSLRGTLQTPALRTGYMNAESLDLMRESVARGQGFVLYWRGEKLFRRFTASC